MDMITTIDIKSQEFKDNLRRHFLEFTDHFIYEFRNFVQSPFDMTGYDHFVKYNEHSSLETSSQEEVSVLSFGSIRSTTTEPSDIWEEMISDEDYELVSDMSAREDEYIDSVVNYSDAEDVVILRDSMRNREFRF